MKKLMKEVADHFSTQFIFCTLMYLMVAFMFTGCNVVRKVPGFGKDQPNPDFHAVNPNDFVVTGTTTKDHESVYLKVKDHTVTVEVLRPGESTWITLERPDKFDYYDSYQLFQIPQEGVYFGNWAYTNSTGGETFTSVPSAPKGTQYRIHSVSVTAGAEHSHELY